MAKKISSHRIDDDDVSAGNRQVCLYLCVCQYYLASIMQAPESAHVWTCTSDRAQHAAANACVDCESARAEAAATPTDHHVRS